MEWQMKSSGVIVRAGSEENDDVTRCGLLETSWDVTFPLLDFLVPKRFGRRTSPVCGLAFLSGPPKCGKTSLLLQLAYNLAIDAAARVVFLCKPRNFDNDHIYLAEILNSLWFDTKSFWQGLDTSSEVFDRIHIKYINDDEDVHKYFAAFHMHVDLPTAVIVDDFVDLFGKRWEGLRGAREKSMVKIMCLCRSAIDYANEKAASGLGCGVIISDTHHLGGPRFLYIFKRWVSKVFVIKGLNWQSTFTLEVEHAQDGRNNENNNVVGIFTLADQLLHFNGLETNRNPLESHEQVSKSQ